MTDTHNEEDVPPSTTDEHCLEEAWHWLCRSRHHFPPNADLWDLRFHVDARRGPMLAQLTTGTYRLSPMQWVGGVLHGLTGHPRMSGPLNSSISKLSRPCWCILYVNMSKATGMVPPRYSVWPSASQTATGLYSESVAPTSRGITPTSIKCAYLDNCGQSSRTRRSGRSLCNMCTTALTWAAILTPNHRYSPWLCIKSTYRCLSCVFAGCVLCTKFGLLCALHGRRGAVNANALPAVQCHPAVKSVFCPVRVCPASGKNLYWPGG